MRYRPCLALCLAIAGCGGQPVAPPPPRPVETMVVRAARGGTSSTYPGEIVSRYQVELGFRVAGAIIERPVDVGSRVTAGQVLARIDPSDADLKLQGAQAQASSAASASAQQATDLARSRKLLAEGFISQAEFDRQRVSVDQARAQVRTAQTQRAGAARQLGYTVLRAERAGVVTAVSGNVGTVVPAGQAVVTLAALDGLEVAISIPEGEVADLRGARLGIRLWSAPDALHAGLLRTLSPAADPRTRTFDARVSFADDRGGAALGGTAEVVATNPVRAGLLRVPVAAVTQRGGRAVVWVVAGTPARATPRAVTMTQVQQNAVLITGGLRVGERIVTAGVHLLHPGDVVRPVASPADPTP